MSLGLWKYGKRGGGGLLHGCMVDIIMLRLQCVSCVQQVDIIMAVIKMHGPHCTGKTRKMATKNNYESK